MLLVVCNRFIFIHFVINYNDDISKYLIMKFTFLCSTINGYIILKPINYFKLNVHYKQCKFNVNSM